MKGILWIELNNQQAEAVTGGERDWPTLEGYPLPPGIVDRITQTGSIPPGIVDVGGVPNHGQKNGWVPTSVGLIPPGWEAEA